MGASFKRLKVGVPAGTPCCTIRQLNSSDVPVNRAAACLMWRIVFRNFLHTLDQRILLFVPQLMRTSSHGAAGSPSGHDASYFHRSVVFKLGLNPNKTRAYCGLSIIKCQHWRRCWQVLNEASALNEVRPSGWTEGPPGVPKTFKSSLLNPCFGLLHACDRATSTSLVSQLLFQTPSAPL